MKISNIKIFCFSFMLFICLYVHAETIRVCWLGNSYTTTGNLPNLVAQLASAAGDTILYRQNAPGGYRLMNHVQDANSLGAINADQWDFVVIQAQSQEPSFPPAQVEAEVYPYADILDSLIHANRPCSQTVFYMSWGRKYGDNQNCAMYPVVCTYEGMTQRLRESYQEMANQLGGLIAPAGMAWYHSRMQDSTINLWSADNSHPSAEGAYLNACVFYATFFRKSCAGNPYTAGLSSANAVFLQQIGSSTVLDSLSEWNIGKLDPNANFIATDSGLQALLIADSTTAAEFEWNLGDGSTASGPSVVHTYPRSGTYTIQLVVGDGCGKTDSIEQNISVSLPSGIHEAEARTLQLLPTGMEGEFRFEGTAPCHLELYYPDGRLAQTILLQPGETISLKNYQAAYLTALMLSGNQSAVKKLWSFNR